MDSSSVRSHLQPQHHFHETDAFTQNRRQEVVNRGALPLCGGLYVCAEGGLTFKVDKCCIDLQRFIFQFWGAWSYIWGNKPTKAPSGDGTGFTLQLAPQSLSPVLCWEFSVVWYIDWLIVLSNMTQHVCDKVVLGRSSFNFG